MFTLFDLLKLTGVVTGAVIGGCLGYQAFGWLTAIIGVPLGIIMGAFIGNLPWVAAWLWMRYDLKRCSIPELKERLQSQRFISHLLIAELVSRGEPLEQFRDYVASSLRSDGEFGESTARIWFPDLLPDSSSPPPPATPPTASERNT